MATRLAFIGLGIMGQPMAAHLLQTGNPLTLYTRTREKASDLLAAGAAWAATPADAARQADVVFLCLPDTPDIEAVILGADGIVPVARKGLIVIDHSTISPSATRRMAEVLAEKGTALLDAPISGGDVGARNATLSIMVGGDEAAYKQVLPLLERLGRTITWCGPSGSGQLTKLVNQILVTVTNLAVCEAMNFAQANGLDMQKTLTAVGGGAAGSWQLANLGPKMIAGDDAPGFMIDLQSKDLRLVRETAGEAGLSLQATAMVTRLFDQAIKQGCGRDGTQALYKIVKQQSKKTSSR